MTSATILSLAAAAGSMIASAASAAALVAWRTTQKRTVECERLATEYHNSVENRLQSLAAAIESAQMPTIHAGSQPALNLARRARALHMQRRGDDASTISAALDITSEELTMLSKIDRLMQARRHDTSAQFDVSASVN